MGTLQFGMMAGFLTGLTFISVALGVTYLFEFKPLRLFLINAGYQTLVFTAIPPSVTFGGALAFGAADMKGIFDYGVRCGASNRLWTTPTDAIAQADNQSSLVVPPAEAACPRLLPQ